MELSTVIGIIVIIAVAVLLMKFLGKMVSFAFSVIGIVLVVWLVVAGLRYLDEQNVRDNLLDSNSLFVLEDEGNTLTGFATQDGEPAEVTGIEEELENPNSRLYDRYYKIFVVKREALPEKTALMVEVADEQDRLRLFRNYVEKDLLEGDFVDSIVQAEQEGKLEVHKETLAFRHGVKEVLGSG